MESTATVENSESSVRPPFTAKAKSDGDEAARALKTIFARVVNPRWKLAAITCSILVVRDLAEVTSVYLLSPVINSVSEGLSAGKSSSDQLHQVFMAVIVMFVAQLVLNGLISTSYVWNAKLSSRLMAAMRASVYDHLQRLTFSFYDTNSAGRLINRTVGDLQAIHSFINMSLLWTLDIIIFVFAYLGLLAWRSPTLGLVALLPVPLWCFLVLRLSKRAIPLYKNQQAAADGMMSVVSENINGSHVVRALGSARLEDEKFREKSRGLLERTYSILRWQSTLNPLLQCVAAGAHILLLFVGAKLVAQKIIPVGDLLILGAAMSTILAKLTHINPILETYQRAKVSALRLNDILGTEAFCPNVIGQEKFNNPKGDIEFRGVNFSYIPEKSVFRSFSKTIGGGRVTAIVGPTGSGKSTLTALLGRFYDIESGQILVGGQDLRSIRLRELRKHIGYVFQEAFLFSDTIRNNIRYGRSDVSDEMLQKAARAAHADEFILSLPQGYDTVLGEHGVQLSGGQRQRLAIARALVYDPEILILDDALSALDASTESLVRTQIRPLFQNRTVLIIAHRASTLDLADETLRLGAP